MKIWNWVSNLELYHILRLFDHPCSVVSGREIKKAAKEKDIYRTRLINDLVHEGILYPKTTFPPHNYELTKYGIAIWYDVEKSERPGTKRKKKAKGRGGKK